MVARCSRFSRLVRSIPVRLAVFASLLLLLTAFDSHRNFARSLVATAPSPASSGTSLVVTAGEGTRFTAPCNATIGPANTVLTPANSEIVRVTNVSTDTLTITRIQESTSARSVVVGDQIVCGPTAKVYTDIEALAIDRTTQPRAGVYNSATQSMTNNAFTTLTFDSEDYDVGAIHSTSVNTSRLTVPSGGDGVYLVTGFITFDANATGRRIARLLKNGSEILRAETANVGASGLSAPQLTQVLSLTAGDYLELSGFQDSGGALNSGSATKFISNFFTLTRLW